MMNSFPVKTSPAESRIRDRIGGHAAFPGPVTRETGLAGVTLDFNYGARLKVPEGNYHVRFTDQDAGCVLFDADFSGAVAVSLKKYYVRFLVELWKDGVQILRHGFDPKGKNIRFWFPSGVLGDLLAWFPYAEAFRRKHGCRVFCCLQEKIAEILCPAYPEITFLPPESEVPDCYATYYMGIFPLSDQGNHQPVDFRLTGLQRCIPLMLGLENEELRPVLTPCSERKIREPYVCIAVQSTAQRKCWNNPAGWQKTVAHLKRLGYRVLCIDREPSVRFGSYENSIPPGAEDFTGDLPLQQRVDLLGHADFFVGLSSGLAWLAWGAGTPVVMISGFTLPFNEFYTPYRVINYHACNGCWHDGRLEANSSDVLYCPRLGGTARAFECSALISAEQVCGTIDRLISERGLVPPAGGPETGQREGSEVLL